MVVMPAWEAQQMRMDLARATLREAEFEQSQRELQTLCVPAVAVVSSDPADCQRPSLYTFTPPQRTALGERAPSSASRGQETIEDGAVVVASPQPLQPPQASWKEAHEALRAEIANEFEALRKGREEQQRESVRLLTEFEVELTTALEARAKEADGVLERKLIDAGEGMSRRLVTFEEAVNDDRARLIGLEGHAQGRLTELEAVVQAEKTRSMEQGQTFGEALHSAKEQLASLRPRVNQLQEDSNETKEQLVSWKQRMQQLQEDREDVKEQLASVRQRFSTLMVEGAGTATSASTEAEWRRLGREMENRMQRFDDSLGARLRESEARLRTDVAEEVAALRQRVQPLLDASVTAAAGGFSSTSGSVPPELERRLQRLDEALGTKICETEGRLLSQQRALEDQQRALELQAHELQRHVGDTEHRLHGEVRSFEARATGERFEERLEEFRRSYEFEISTVRERMEGVEMRCVEESRELLRRGLEEAEARSLGATEAGVAAQLDAFRAEVQAWPYARQQSLALGDVDRQLAQSEDERRLLSEQLDALADRQRRQQHLLEDLLSAAARRPSGHIEGSAGAGAASAGPLPANTETTDAIGRRMEVFSTRLAAIEDRLPGSAGGSSSQANLELTEALGKRFDALSTRVASVEDRVAGSTGSTQASAEVTEAIGKRLEAVSTRLASLEDRNPGAGGSNTLVNADLTEAVSRRFESLSVRLASVEERAADQALNHSVNSSFIARLVAVEERLGAVTLAASRRSGGELGQGAFPEARGGVNNSYVVSAAVDLAERCSGRLDLLSARVASIEDRVAALGPGNAGAEVQEALRAWPSKLETLAAKVDSGSEELRTELVRELHAGLRRVEDESVKHRAEIEAVLTRNVDSNLLERQALADEMSAHMARTRGAEQAASVAESKVAQVAEEARTLRHLASIAEMAHARSAAVEEAAQASIAASKAPQDEERELAAMIRLETCVEAAEARQNVAISEVSMRLENELRRVRAQASENVASMHGDISGVSLRLESELRRVSAQASEDAASMHGDDVVPPWLPAVRSLERELKVLLAAQAEDSAAAFRSMALMVEESVLRGDTTASIMRPEDASSILR